ncbi:helix-turn-helix transcriptional regulator [Cellulosilyticum ruminicola]|uniref:helix-turn-helix transcriptional regulator n=1 Tax=Cellulosilyticum ruminicola TaxID=425254 RepID=UPI0006D1A4F7|nr:AraC family transcriptional regulator [Cellulosilyticum ruminicola]
MIEHLNGIHEIVDYKANTNLRLYDNTVCENYPAHWHTPIEIIMPISNNYTIILNDIVRELHPSDIIFISPGVVHELKAPPFGRRIIFQAELTLLRQLKDFESISNLISPAIIITSETHPHLHAILQKKLLDIFNEYTSTTPYYELAIYSNLMDMLINIGRHNFKHTECFTLNNQIPKEHIDKFMSICDYITAHCTENLTLNDIAHLAGFSKYHFARLFKQFTNTTFYKYLTKKRIEYAEQLLINPNLPITEIALQSGFSNQSAFIRMFKLTKSCTPTEFRNMYHA